MKKHTLKATLRTQTGRKVKQIRKSGYLPATIYGKHMKSISITLPVDQFELIYTETGKTGLVDVTVGTEVHPSLIHNVQKHPIDKRTLHVEFYHVDLKEKVTANIPVELEGESPTVTDKTGVLLQTLNFIEVEALPTDLPDKFEVDVSGLKQVDDSVKISDLKIPGNVTVLSDMSQVVVRVGELVSKEAEAQVAEEKAAEAAAESTTEAQEKPEETTTTNHTKPEETKE